MFTGIIETLGTVVNIAKNNDNLDFTISSSITAELKIDQSVSHNGVCLTVINLQEDVYTVTAIRETLNKTNLNELRVGDAVNLERAMILGARLDGHIVQGHVDQIGICTIAEERNGSWYFTFEYDSSLHNTTIEKGSITVDGTSLTVVDSKKDSFSVAVIPYTFNHTRFKTYQPGTLVNLEFDVIGKYVAKLMGLS